MPVPLILGITDLSLIRQFYQAYQQICRQVISKLEKEEGEQFDKIHSVERALKVGDIAAIIPSTQLPAAIRQYLKQLLATYNPPAPQ